MKCWICDKCGLYVTKRTPFGLNDKVTKDLCDRCSRELLDIIEAWFKGQSIEIVDLGKSIDVVIDNLEDNTHDKYPLGSVKYG